MDGRVRASQWSGGDVWIRWWRCVVGRQSGSSRHVVVLLGWWVVVSRAAAGASTDRPTDRPRQSRHVTQRNPTPSIGRSVPTYLVEEGVLLELLVHHGDELIVKRQQRLDERRVLVRVLLALLLLNEAKRWGARGLVWVEVIGVAWSLSTRRPIPSTSTSAGKPPHARTPPRQARKQASVVRLYCTYVDARLPLVDHLVAHALDVRLHDLRHGLQAVGHAREEPVHARQVWWVSFDGGWVRRGGEMVRWGGVGNASKGRAARRVVV